MRVVYLSGMLLAQILEMENTMYETKLKALATAIDKIAPEYRAEVEEHGLALTLERLGWLVHMDFTNDGSQMGFIASSLEDGDYVDQRYVPGVNTDTPPELAARTVVAEFEFLERHGK